MLADGVSCLSSHPQPQFASPLGCQVFHPTPTRSRLMHPCFLYPSLHPSLPKIPPDRPSSSKKPHAKNLSCHRVILRKSEQGCDYYPCCDFARAFHPRGRMELTPTPAPFRGSGKTCPHPKMNRAGARSTPGSARLVHQGQLGAHPETKLLRLTIAAQAPAWLYAALGVLCVCGGGPKLRYGAAAALAPPGLVPECPLPGGKGNATAFPIEGRTATV